MSTIEEKSESAVNCLIMDWGGGTRIPKLAYDMRNEHGMSYEEWISFLKENHLDWWELEPTENGEEPSWLVANYKHLVSVGIL